MPSARWTMIILCCLANTINYIDRANLAVAAPIMQREFGFELGHYRIHPERVFLDLCRHAIAVRLVCRSRGSPHRPGGRRGVVVYLHGTHRRGTRVR